MRTLLAAVLVALVGTAAPASAQVEAIASWDYPTWHAWWEAEVERDGVVLPCGPVSPVGTRFQCQLTVPAIAGVYRLRVLDDTTQPSPWSDPWPPPTGTAPGSGSIGLAIVPLLTTPPTEPPDMASVTDDFSTDPFASRWVNERHTSTWDSTNGEFDANTSTSARGGARYQAQVFSLDHEAQATFSNPELFGGGMGGPAVRMDGGNDDWYYVEMDYSASELRLCMVESGGRNVLQTWTVASARFNFFTVRLAAQGANGANVVLSIWITNHGGTSAGAGKPGADPGWIGVDATPDYTYTHTAADRLDNSATHLYGGLGWGAQGNEVDSQHDWWKARDIADRAGAPAGIVRQMLQQHH